MGKRRGECEQNKGMKEKRVESSLSKRLVRSRCRLTIIFYRVQFQSVTARLGDPRFFLICFFFFFLLQI